MLEPIIDQLHFMIQNKKKNNRKIKKLLDNKTYKLITTDVLKFNKFYRAEEYHQDYKKKTQMIFTL